MNIEKVVGELAKSLDEKKILHFVSQISNQNLPEQKNICQILFKLFDHEMEKKSFDELYVRILIAIPVELAFYAYQNNQQNQSYHELIEFISGNLISRGNLADDSLRLASVVFYSYIKSQPTWKKQKILERFGENVLESVFNIYIENNKKTEIAFHFLAENLESFLSLSAELASMTNQFLQKIMLKFPAHFIRFIKEYKNYLFKRENVAEFFVVHLSFFVRQSFEIMHEDLMYGTIKELIEYIQFFESRHDLEHKNMHIFTNIMIQSKSLKARETALYVEKLLEQKQKITCKNLLKILNLQEGELFSPSISSKKEEQVYLPFQKILLLFNK